jgi:phosphotransferase family enzyme
VSEQSLTGGAETLVVRSGDTVRRAVGPWTPAVHALLQHLAARGFKGAPRVLGIDERGREILTYLEGQTDVVPKTDGDLACAAQLLRRYHDAVADFPTEGTWRNWFGVLEPEIVCHNDCGPWNLVTGPDGPYAFIDWDWASPGLRMWDVAYAAQSMVTLTPSETGDVERRLILFCDAYGLSLSEREMFPHVIVERTRATYEQLVRRSSAGEEPWRRLSAAGHADGWRASLEFVTDRRDRWTRLLRS